ARRAGRGGARGPAGEGAGRLGRHGLRGRIGPLLCAPSVSIGEGLSYRLRSGKSPGRAGRRPRPVHPGGPAGARRRGSRLVGAVHSPDCFAPGASGGPAPGNNVQEPTYPTPQSTAVVEAPIAAPPRPSAASMIVYEGVTKVYEPDVVALKDVSFHIDKGE